MFLNPWEVIRRDVKSRVIDDTHITDNKVYIEEGFL